MTNETHKDAHTHRLFLCEQLFIVLSVAPKLLRQLHLAVYGLRQVLGQDVLSRLTRTQQTKHKKLLNPSLSADYERTPLTQYISQKDRMTKLLFSLDPVFPPSPAGSADS